MKSLAGRWRRRVAPPVPARLPIPEGFDWRTYVSRYPDLRTGGIDSEAVALDHWHHYGRPEGRSFAPLTWPTRRTHACASVHSLYLRASGALTCWGDAGGDRVLQPYDPGVDYAEDVVFGPVFERVRRRLYDGRMPWSDLCGKCLAFRVAADHSSQPADDRVVEMLQVEPSVACALACPGCFDQERRRAIPGPRHLAPGILAKVLEDLRHGHARVRAFDFQGHGDPLSCPHLPSLIQIAREHFPAAFVTMTTHANGRVDPGLLDAGVDEVVCSIDGVDAESYAGYRVGGSFSRALGFLEALAAAARARGGRPRVVWKYILFEHNSAPEQLLRAQELGHRAGIDAITFVFTRNGPRSRRITAEDHVPRLDGGIPVRFSYHRPDRENLLEALALARRRMRRNDFDGARELAAGVVAMMDRFFPAQTSLDADQAALASEAREIVAALDLEQERSTTAITLPA